MTELEFRAVTAADLSGMVDLLLSRQRLEGGAFPFLQNSCLNVKHGTKMLEALFQNSTPIGMGAFEKNELVGYMIGQIKADTLRGRHVWVPYEGMAVRADQSPELVRSLYAKVSIVWLKQGCFAHYIIVPLGGEAYLDAVQRLSFAIQQVHGVLNLAEYRPFARESDAQVRIAGKADRAIMGRMSGIIQTYQNAAPTFEPMASEVMADIKSGYESTVEDDAMTILLAEKDGEELGFQVYEAAAPALMAPDGGAELSIAGTYPGRMGTGVGKKLMDEGCALMKARSFRHVITDWRITNLASSTFWPKCGFKPVAYRMVRYINSNWAVTKLDSPAIQ